MYKYFITCIFSIFTLTYSLHSLDIKLLDKFHICTVSNIPHPNLDKLKESCIKHHITLDVLGMDLLYPANGMKYFHVSDYLNNFDDSEIVMFVDAWDVLIVEDKVKILSKFLKRKANILISAEINCWPYPDLADEYPNSPTPFKYINTGSYIGYVKDLKEWINDINPIAYKGDQGQTTLNYLYNLKNGKEVLALDYYCELFLPLYLVKPEEVFIDIKKKKVHCFTTGSTPSVIHANGQSYSPIWDEVYEKLVAKKNCKPIDVSRLNTK